MVSLLEAARDAVLDLVFPTRCLGCDAPGQWFCETCLTASRLTRSLTHCQRCNRFTRRPGRLCGAHRQALGLHGLASLGDFHAPPLRRAIHLGKYEAVGTGLTALTTHLLERVEPVLAAVPVGVLVPLPLSAPRLRTRGYNQSLIIARELERRTGHALSLGLTRRQDAGQQVGRSRAERLDAMDGVFAWRGEHAPRSVILVDDVITTGATLRAAAQALRTAGAREIYALTLADEV
ncbi:ComF family protein [Candidatus Berkelbacteria bacterium]|nr:ComF family protein [Candidatus Berkelbacteria bacterium]